MEEKSDAQKSNSDQNERKPGETSDDRTISDDQAQRNQRLKIARDIDKNLQSEQQNQLNSKESEEYQHIVDPNENDKDVTMDNASENQSEKIRNNKMDETDEMDVQDNAKEEISNENQNSEEMNDVTDEIINKKAKNSKTMKEGQECNVDQDEPRNETDIELVLTHDVPRNDDTFAHTS